jgi:hypothetical protein
MYHAARQHADSMVCINNLKQIGVAARIWANEYGTDKLPSDLISISNQLVTPNILICRADHSRVAATNWAVFTTNSTSYEILAPGLRDGDREIAYIRCKIHNYVVFGDGSVEMEYTNYAKPESR